MEKYRRLCFKDVQTVVECPYCTGWLRILIAKQIIMYSGRAEKILEENKSSEMLSSAGCA